jgi:pilus assembly protein Flp/PilA
MKRFILKWKLWKDTRGQDLIEYALMAGLVAVVAVAAMPTVAQSITTIFSAIDAHLSNVATSATGS